MLLKSIIISFGNLYVASTPTPTSDWRSARRKQRAIAESTDAVIQPRSPTVYDW